MIRRRAATTAIGLDLGVKTLRALQLQRRRGRWETLDAVALTRTNPGQTFDVDEALRLAAVLGRRSFVGRNLVVSLPNRDLIRGLVEVNDQTDGGPMYEAALEIERTHHLEPGTYELAAWMPPASGARRQTTVCVNGCRHRDAQTLLDAFDAAGLSVAALDSRACAIGRALETPHATPQELTAVLDIETDSTELILLHEGNVVYQRGLIDAGLDQAEKRLAGHGLDADAAHHALTTIGLSDLEHAHAEPVRKALVGYTRNLVQEAEPALDYAARIYTDLPIERFAVVGGGAAVPGLGYELQQQLRLRGRATPTEAASLDDASVFAVALGLTQHPEEASWAAA
ncbi:MAG: pilus assembly protein PilM [Planctomycetota bacterium]